MVSESYQGNHPRPDAAYRLLQYTIDTRTHLRGFRYLNPYDHGRSRPYQPTRNSYARAARGSPNEAGVGGEGKPRWNPFGGIVPDRNRERCSRGCVNGESTLGRSDSRRTGEPVPLLKNAPGALFPPPGFATRFGHLVLNEEGKDPCRRTDLENSGWLGWSRDALGRRAFEDVRARIAPNATGSNENPFSWPESSKKQENGRRCARASAPSLTGGA